MLIMPRVWPWLAALAACSVGELDLGGKACPCTSGYVCDPSRGLCVLGSLPPGGDAGREAGGDGAPPNAEGGSDAGVDGVADGTADGTTLQCGGLTACGSACVDTRNDPHNCGRCGHDCLGGTCSASACQPVVLVSGIVFESGPILSGASLYWGTQSDMETCPTSGCPMGATQVSPLYLPTMGSIGFPVSMVADSTQLYWTQDGPPGTVVSAPLAGGMPTLLYSGASSALASLAVDPGNVYWSDMSGMSLGVYRCVLTGMGCTSPLLVTGGQVYPSYLTVQGSSLYWLDGITTMSLKTCTVPVCSSVTTLTANLASAESLTLDTSNAYWAANAGGMTGQGSVQACPLMGCVGGPRTIASGLTQPGGVTVDATGVYFTESPSTGSVIERCPLAGCTSAPELVLATTARMLLGDATSLYFTDANGDILRLAK